MAKDPQRRAIPAMKRRAVIRVGVEGTARKVSPARNVAGVRRVARAGPY